MDQAISAAALLQQFETGRSPNLPLVLDVRRTAAFISAPDLIAGALRRDPADVSQWSHALPRQARIVVYCVHGHEVSQGVASALRGEGLDCRYLEHGIEGWRQAGGRLYRKPVGAATGWVTRARPKIDRIACPWLVARFIDKDARFLYVPADQVMHVAAEQGAIAFDVKDAELGHRGDQCSFDAFLAAHRLTDAGLQRLALIVRAADTGNPGAAPEAAGLLAISQGLSQNYPDDHAMLEHGMVVYDALYAACGGVRGWA